MQLSNWLGMIGGLWGAFFGIFASWNILKRNRYKLVVVINVISLIIALSMSLVRLILGVTVSPDYFPYLQTGLTLTIMFASTLVAVSHVIRRRG